MSLRERIASGGSHLAISRMISGGRLVIDTCAGFMAVERCSWCGGWNEDRGSFRFHRRSVVGDVKLGSANRMNA